MATISLCYRVCYCRKKTWLRFRIPLISGPRIGVRIRCGIKPPVQIQRLEERTAAEDSRTLRAVFFSISLR